MIKEVCKKIEDKRGSSKLLWRILVISKDTVFFTGAFIIGTIMGFFSFVVRRYEDASICKRYSSVQKFYKVSFCITCHNRAFHLKKTLKKNIKDNSSYPYVEFLILDYNSKDDLKAWVFRNFDKELRSGKLTYIQTKIPQTFHMSNAKNISKYFASGDIVCNLDADNFTGRHFAKYINYVCNKERNIIGSFKYKGLKNWKNNQGFGGRIFLFKEDLLKLGGYDESFNGWGLEDNDFHQRALRYGLKGEPIPMHFSKCIGHSNKYRDLHLKVKLNKSRVTNLEIFNKNNENEVIKIKDPQIPVDAIRLYPQKIDARCININNRKWNKVFEIGDPKTGTSSLACAFKNLGIKTIEWDAKLDKEASKGKFYKVIQKAHKYSAFADGPWHDYELYKKFDTMFPKSKFILIEREHKSWLESYKKHFSIEQNVNNIDPKYVVKDFSLKEDEILAKHINKYKEIREYFKDRSDDLLVMNVCDGDGWEKLCVFLDLPIPEQDFPWSNKSIRKLN